MSANAYEQITFEQLTNRAYVEGTCMGITPILADTFYSVQYWVDSKGGWWNAFETVDQTAAENEIATWRKTGGDNRMRIVEVTVPEVVGTIMGSDDEMRIIVIPNENEVVGTRNSTGALDSQYTVTESIRAMTPGATFTDEQIIKALIKKYPNEGYEFDPEYLQRSVPRHIRRTLCNRMSPASLRLCEQLEDGSYRRLPKAPVVAPQADPTQEEIDAICEEAAFEDLCFEEEASQRCES